MFKVFALLCLFLSAAVTADSDEVNVTLSTGTVLRGKVCAGYETEGIRCFFGVPYAEPPTGDNRFRPTIPFNYTGIDSLLTKKHASRCMQGGRASVSEDCLFLDVYAPPAGVTPKAVMVFIHGGCFTNGGPVQYPGSDMVATGDVMVVIIHYRLGVFGFLGADQLRYRDEERHSTGNYATYDQLMSLRWVQDYAAAFGASGDKVTVFGQSSGACSVASVISVPEELQSYKGKALFTSAIIESGGFAQWASQPMKVSQDQYAAVMSELSCSITDVDCLIGKTAKELQTAFTDASPWNNPRCRDGCQISPAVDGKMTLAMTGEMKAAGRKIPTMQGWCQDDGSDMISYDLPVGYSMTEDEYHQFWDRYRGSGFDEERELYFNAKNFTAFGSISQYWMAADAVVTTAGYECPVHQQLNLGGADLYAYVFDHHPEDSPDSLVTHSCELSYLFNPLGSNDYALSTQMREWWTNFAVYENPNGKTGQTWPKATPENPQVMRIQENSAAEVWPESKQCEFWETVDKGNFFNTCNSVYWKDPISVASKLTTAKKDEL